MTTVDVLPDAELVAIDYLLAQPEIATLVGARISNTSPSSPTYPYLTVERVGGRRQIRVRLDNARLQVGAWGATRTEASLLARTAEAALIRMKGYVHDTGVVGLVDSEMGPSWMPDTVRLPPTPRFIFTVAARLHVP